MLKAATNLVRKFTGSLRFKLSFYAGLVMFLMVVAFTYFSIRAQEKSLISALVDAALKDSEVIKAAIWNGMMTKDREVIREIVRAVGKQEGFKEINIYDRRGVRHYTSLEKSPSGMDQSVQRTGDSGLLKDIGTDTSTRFEINGVRKILTVVNPVRNSESCSSAACHAHPDREQVLGALEVKLPMQELQNRLHENALNQFCLRSYCLFQSPR